MKGFVYVVALLFSLPNLLAGVASLVLRHTYATLNPLQIVTDFLFHEKAGYKTSEVRIHSTINGWYFGNLLLGGVIGMVVVDPLTGAMYTLSPDHIQETLTPTQRSGIKKAGGLGIILKEQLSPEQIRNLKSLATQS